MPLACATPLFAHRACMWVVALLKLPVRESSPLVSSKLVCAGLLMAWMPSCPYVLPSSTAPLICSGRPRLSWLLDSYNFFIHTARQSLEPVCVYHPLAKCGG